MKEYTRINKKEIVKKLESLFEINFSTEQVQSFVEKERRMFNETTLKVNFFSNNQEDEFFVFDENNERTGIFKTWALPIIPFLESNRIEGFKLLLGSTNHLKERITKDQNLYGPFLDWRNRNSEQPARFYQSMERWRSFSQVNDKRLTEYFEDTPLPEDKIDRTAELFLRLTVAFEMSAPFYNIEAIVGDVNNTKFNPSSSSKETAPSGGSLDVIGMLLPSAIPDVVLSSKLNWNELGWKKVRSLWQHASAEDQKIIFRIAKEIDVHPEEVIFAANVLEWIPVSVGGKKGDLPVNEARELIQASLKNNSAITTDSVAGNTNALIRFLNWFPTVKRDINFNGSGWRYAAVCDTSSELVKFVQHNDVLKSDYQNVFQSKISPQIDNVDATSAKGRLMLQILKEGKFKDEVYSKIKARHIDFNNEVNQALGEKRRLDYLVNINDHNPKAIVGCKSSGIREAGDIFGIDNVIPGVTITSEAVSDFLQSNPIVWTKIVNLELETDIDKKLKIAKFVRDEISLMSFPLFVNIELNNESKIAVRSSSFDEDSDITGTAAGIYESLVCDNSQELNKSVLEVITSFFSEKAISYRALSGLSDIPMFAVILNPFIEGPGGIVFSSGNQDGWEIVTGKTPSHISDSNKSDFDSYKLDKTKSTVNALNNWVDISIINKIGQMAKKAEEFTGKRVDIEFVVDQKKKIWILQLRSLRDKEKDDLRNESVSPQVNIMINDFKDLDTIQTNSNNINLSVSDEIDLNQFQGNFFRWLIKNRNLVKDITLSKRVPRTGHFANICYQLGIKLNFNSD